MSATSNPTGSAIYDSIMSGIEPELLSAVISTLGETYKNETKEESAARAKRYEAAFAEYDKQFEQFTNDVKAGATHARKEALRSAEADARSEEQTNLAKIESLFTTP